MVRTEEAVSPTQIVCLRLARYARVAPVPSCTTVNGAVHIGSDAPLLDQLVPEPLVVALLMVLLRVFLHGLAKVTLAQWDDLRQTL